MVIRPEQMDALSASSLDTFESDMLSHLNRCFPAECAALGEEEVRDTIRYGIGRSRAYGITVSREVCTYVDLMIVFGRDFDIDRHLPWAAATLTSKRWKDSSAKIDNLYRAAKEHYHQRRSYAS